jgi:ubiquitin-protein ligase
MDKRSSFHAFTRASASIAVNRTSSHRSTHSLTNASSAIHALLHNSAEERKPVSQPTHAQYFRRYELMMEYVSLRNPKHCPLGVYVMPGLDDMDTWYGVCFIDSGYYRNAVFKFKIDIPEDYPYRVPQVTFITDVFHPLIDPSGRLSLRHRFPHWEAHRDHIFHILRYLRDIFRRSSLDRLEEHQCYNREALQMYRQDPNLFAKLAQQCSSISTKDSILYENHPDNNSIRFTRLTDLKQEEAFKHMLENVPTTDPAARKNLQEVISNLKELKAKP